jgi:hypothetical protein
MKAASLKGWRSGGRGSYAMRNKASLVGKHSLVGMAYPWQPMYDRLSESKTDKERVKRRISEG